MRPLPNVDPSAVLRSLGIAGVRAARPVSGGSTTAIWRVDTESGRYALRVFAPGHEDVCEREALIMEAAAAAGIPVPAIHAQGSWHDRPVSLLAWCPGRPLLHHLLHQPWRAPFYGREFGRTQAAIHAIKAPDVPALEPGSWVDRVASGEGWLRQRLHADDVQRDALIHMDYHPLNVMADGGRITGVLDWTNGGAGDPRADVARTRTILRLDMGRPYLPRPAQAGLGCIWAAFEWGWWKGYHEVAGPAENMALFYAAAGSYMEEDLARRYTPEQLAHVSRWTQRWKARGASDACGDGFSAPDRYPR